MRLIINQLISESDMTEIEHMPTQNGQRSQYIWGACKICPYKQLRMALQLS